MFFRIFPILYINVYIFNLILFILTRTNPLQYCNCFPYINMNLRCTTCSPSLNLPPHSISIFILWVCQYLIQQLYPAWEPRLPISFLQCYCVSMPFSQMSALPLHRSEAVLYHLCPLLLCAYKFIAISFYIPYACVSMLCGVFSSGLFASYVANPVSVLWNWFKCILSSSW